MPTIAENSVAYRTAYEILEGRHRMLPSLYPVPSTGPVIEWVSHKCWQWDFPGGPVVKTLCFQCRGLGSIPGRGTEDPHTVQHGGKKESVELIFGQDCVSTNLKGIQF